MQSSIENSIHTKLLLVCAFSNWQPYIRCILRVENCNTITNRLVYWSRPQLCRHIHLVDVTKSTWSLVVWHPRTIGIMRLQRHHKKEIGKRNGLAKAMLLDDGMGTFTGSTVRMSIQQWRLRTLSFWWSLWRSCIVPFDTLISHAQTTEWHESTYISIGAMKGYHQKSQSIFADSGSTEWLGCIPWSVLRRRT
jgi:hypothetical protein